MAKPRVTTLARKLLKELGIKKLARRLGRSQRYVASAIKRGRLSQELKEDLRGVQERRVKAQKTARSRKKAVQSRAIEQRERALASREAEAKRRERILEEEKKAFERQRKAFERARERAEASREAAEKARYRMGYLEIQAFLEGSDLREYAIRRGMADKDLRKLAAKYGIPIREVYSMALSPQAWGFAA